MNESEQQRILKMVADGIISPEEAKKLLASLAPQKSDSQAVKPSTMSAPPNSAEPKTKDKTIEVPMQRPDGSSYTVQLPPDLIPMFWELAKVAIKESARNAAQETVEGLKIIAKNKTAELKSALKNRHTRGSDDIHGEGVKNSVPMRGEARRQVLQMVANGRIKVEDAARLIEQIDAMEMQNSQNAAIQNK